MLCEHAYYKTDEQLEKPSCNNAQKIAEDDLFKEQCPFIYYCPISERFENTTDMFGCKYKGVKNDGQ